MYKLRKNSKGVFVGRKGNIKRIASFTYEVPSESQEGQAYKVYVVQLYPYTYRCTCPHFLFVGDCKHGSKVRPFEFYIFKKDRRAYQEALLRRVDSYLKTLSKNSIS